MEKSVIIIDNFYDNPNEIRDKALQTDFSVTGNHPGQRTQPFLNDYIKKGIETGDFRPNPRKVSIRALRFG